MIGVDVKKVEETDDKITIYVDEKSVGKAIGQGGAVVRSVELVLGKHIEIKGM